MDKVRRILGVPFLLERNSDIEHSTSVAANFDCVFKGYRALPVEGRIYNHSWRKFDPDEFASYSL